MQRIVVGSRNAGKIREIQAVLADLPYEIVGLPDEGVSDAEETGETFQENAVIKARYYCQHTGEYCLADDSGLEVDALQGANLVRLEAVARQADQGVERVRRQPRAETRCRLLRGIPGIGFASVQGVQDRHDLAARETRALL